jgi:hypothetical protein
VAERKAANAAVIPTGKDSLGSKSRRLKKEADSMVGFRGPLQNHMVRTIVVPLWRIGIVG